MLKTPHLKIEKSYLDGECRLVGSDVPHTLTMVSRTRAFINARTWGT